MLLWTACSSDAMVVVSLEVVHARLLTLLLASVPPRCYHSIYSRASLTHHLVPKLLSEAFRQSHTIPTYMGHDLAH